MKNWIYSNKTLLILSNTNPITQCSINNFKDWLKVKKSLKVKCLFLKYNNKVRVFYMKKYRKSKINLKRYPSIWIGRVLLCKKHPKTKLMIVNLFVDLVWLLPRAAVSIQILVWDWLERVFLKFTKKRFSTTPVLVEWILFSRNLSISSVRITKLVK